MTKPEKPEPVTGLALLRQPFPANQISKLPKETGKQRDARLADQKNNKWPDKCGVCGGYHHPKAVHLDYVGHAALTDRLLDADPLWTWEPVTFGPNGLPALDSNGGMWIKLTVCGVTRLGYGSADGKSGGDAVKELIGDALRNAAMRFGAALDLWHKGDLHVSDEAEEPKDEPKREEPKDTGPSAAVQAAGVAIDLCGSEGVLVKWAADNKRGIEDMSEADQAEVRRRYGRRLKTLRAEADANRKAYEGDNIAYGDDPFEEAA
jgi:hypothetical protein